jgi:glycosyltransferase involved in cell wall biosynthesis
MVDHLRELAGPHAGRLHPVGALVHERLFPLMSRAAVVAMPSYWEALPLALVEAIALGASVVTTSGQGADDVVTDGVDGLLVPRSESDALAGAIDRLLRDRAFAERLGGAARERSEYFDLGPGLERFERFYADVRQRTPSP